MFYVLHGEDEFTRSEELARLKARVLEDGVGELNISAYDGPTTSIAELINASNTLPFFSDRRLIIVTDMLQQYDKRSSARSSEQVDLLVNYLPRLPEKTRLVFTESVQLDEGKGILKRLAALPNAYVRAFPRLNPSRGPDAEKLRQWISARARGKGTSIEAAAATTLIEYAGSDLRQLDAELEKLAARSGYGREVRVDDVVALVTPNPEIRVYEMLDHLGLRRRPEALKSFHTLLASDPRYADGLYPLAMIVVRLSELLSVRDLAINQNLPEAQVQGVLKIEAWRYRRLIDQARLYEDRELMRLIRQALEIDKGLKNGQLDPVLSLEMLIIDATRRSTRVTAPQRERNRSRMR